MTGRRTQPQGGGASIRDFRDLDLLLKLEAEANDEGWIETAYLAQAMGFNGDRPLPSTGLPVRLSWMREYGMLDYDKERRMWRLTGGARRVIEARAQAASMRELEALPSESMVEVMANVIHRYQFADQMTAHMIRREFAYGTARR